MNAEDRLCKIRSIIHETENALDRINCDQLVVLRTAFLEIILATGPQRSGRRRKDPADRQRRSKSPACECEEVAGDDHDACGLPTVPEDQ